MAAQGQLILLLAWDLPGLGHLLAMLAHGQAGARLAVARQLGFEVTGAQFEEGLELVDGSLATVGLEQDPAKAFAHRDRRIGGGINATGNAAVDLPQGDFVGYQQCRFQPGATGLLQIVGRRLR
ncbi:hypothetical protein D9M71_744160 [compost metagenome]